MSTSLLALHEAQVRRDAFAFGPVSLEVAAGEVVALVGPNGAGKSTLLSVAVGEIAPSGGSCLLLGTPPASLRRHEVARRAALMRQGPPPRLPMSVEELALHGRWAHMTGLRFPGAADRRVVAESLARCGAGDLAARDVRTLSGGEMQRVLLAKALAQGSPLLLLDEPASSLDLAHRARLLRLLRELAAAGDRGALVVSHDLDLAAGLCDRVAVMAGGVLLAVGPPEEAFRADILSAAHGWPVLVDRHPQTGRPRATPDFDAPGD